MELQKQELNIRNLEHSLEVLFDQVIPDIEEMEQ